MPAKNTPHHNAHLQIHACVLLWGFTAILGKLISLSALPLVFWRLLLVSGLLLAWPPLWRKLSLMSARRIAACAGVGCIVALHWITFYASIKLSNASVAVTCMALGPFFIAIVEPLMARSRPNVRELALGIAVVPAVALVVGGIPLDMLDGLAVGIVSAFLAAVFGALNKRLVAHCDPLAITALEMCAGLALLSLAIALVFMTGWQDPATAFWPQPVDWLWLVVLAVACTLLPFALSLVALRQISAFSAQLAINLEPVYTLFFAVLLFNEQRDLAWPFYLGVALLVGAVFLNAAWQRRAARA